MRRRVAHALKWPELPEGFWKNTFKGQVKKGEGCWVYGQLLHNSLTGWWWGSRAVSPGLTVSILRLQEACGYAHGHQVANIFPLLERGSCYKNNPGNVHQILLSRYFREEPKQMIWRKACPSLPTKVPWGTSWLQCEWSRAWAIRRWTESKRRAILNGLTLQQFHQCSFYTTC